jgi:hypothetical protein
MSDSRIFVNIDDPKDREHVDVLSTGNEFLQELLKHVPVMLSKNVAEQLLEFFPERLYVVNRSEYHYYTKKAAENAYCSNGCPNISELGAYEYTKRVPAMIEHLRVWAEALTCKRAEPHRFLFRTNFNLFFRMLAGPWIVATRYIESNDKPGVEGEKLGPFFNIDEAISAVREKPYFSASISIEDLKYKDSGLHCCFQYKAFIRVREMIQTYDLKTI